VPSPTSVKGSRSEALAASYLQQQGYRILERNYRCRQGEIDIVAEEGDVLCFVEVRSSRSQAHGSPLETVDRGKQRRVIQAARCYLHLRSSPEREVRFDVVGITFEPERRIELVRGAFE
jgi:putative endonuclease